jgi:hypothetical protein
MDDGLNFGGGIPPAAPDPPPPPTAPASGHTADDDLDFGGYPQPPGVPPDPTGEAWRGPPGPTGPQGATGATGPQGPTGVPNDAPSDGTTYGRLNATWAGALPITGGTLTGPLHIQSESDPTLYIHSDTNWPGLGFECQPGNAAYIYVNVNARPRWEIDLIDATAETGSNAGSDFRLARYSDGGSRLGFPLYISRATGAVTLEANLDITADVADYLGVNITDTSAADGASVQFSATNDLTHYAVYGITGSGFASYADIAYLETNAGGGLQILNDAGAPFSIWMGAAQIVEVTAAGLTLAADPTAALGAATKQYVDAVRTIASAAVKRAGDTMTGPLVLSGNASQALQAVTLQQMNAAVAGVPIGNYLPLTGGTLSGGLGFGSVLAASTTNLSRHLALYGTTYGLNVTNGRLNLVTGISAVVVSNGNDVATINAQGRLVLGYTGNTLTITPNDGARSGNISFLGSSPGSILEFDNPIFVPGIATGTNTGPGIWLGNSSHQIRANSGQDGASMAVCNYSLNSWNGIGIGPNIGTMRIPQWMYGIVFDTRNGIIVNYGDQYVMNGLPSANSTIQHIGFRKSGSDQILELAASAFAPALTSATPVAGGSGCNVNDRFYDAYNNTYTATAVTGGAVTTIRMDAATTRFSTPGANPIALTAAPGFAGTGVTVNLTWTAPSRLVIQTTGGSQSMLLSAPAGIQTQGTLFPVNGIDFGSVLASSVTDFSKHISLYAGWGGINITSGRLNIVAQGQISLVAAGKDIVSCDTNNLYTYLPINLPADPTAAMHAATKQYVDKMLPLAGGTMTGPIVLPADPTANLQAATKQYVDARIAASGVSSFNTRTGAVTLSTADLTGALGIVRDANWNVGINVALPTGPAAGLGALFANLLTAPNHASNLYYDSATPAWRYLGAGQAWLISPATASGSSFSWFYAPNGAAGAVATLQVPMTLSPAGLLQTKGGIFAMNDAGFGLTSDATYKYHAWQSGWSDAWRISDGMRLWGSPSTATAMTLDGSGNLSIAAAFNAAGNVAAGGNLTTRVGNSVFGAGGSGVILQFAPSWYWDWNGTSGVLSWTTTGGAPWWVNVSGTTTQNGNCYAAAYPGPSDARLKRNVQPWTARGLADVVKLQPVSFEFNGEGGLLDDGMTRYGFIAQDAQACLPEAVHVMPQSVSAERAITDQLAFDNGTLTAAMVNAIKELAARVVALETRTLH